MDYLDYIDLLDDDRPPKRQKTFCERYDPISEFSDETLIEDFRFPKHAIDFLVNELNPVLDYKSNRSKALSVELQVLIGLKFLATGDHFNTLKRVFGVDESTVCRVVSRVINGLYQLRKKFIVFPSTEQEFIANAQKFASIAEFPNVIGCVDGTHVPLSNMLKENEALYICRKGGHSVNCQIICDADLKILDVVANFPGTTHDAFIWNQCKIKQKLENGDIPDNFLLLGDSGYPLKPYLMTPIINPRTVAEKRYLKSHCSTRCTVERCIGVLKSRWRCLHISNKLRFRSPAKCCKLMYACCILHNIAHQFNLADPAIIEEQSNDDQNDDDDDSTNSILDIESVDGKSARESIVRLKFSR